MTPRVDPENWRASHDGPARRSNKTPAPTPITRTKRNIMTGSVACMMMAAFGGLDFNALAEAPDASLKRRTAGTMRLDRREVDQYVGQPSQKVGRYSAVNAHSPRFDAGKWRKRCERPGS